MARIVVRIVLEPKGCFRAWCPSLPGCVTHGRSVEEARESIEELVHGYFASMDNPGEATLEFRAETEYMNVGESYAHRA
ncbi:MAG: type II toxin-antitoxin system HicB family antitoxin [Phycisphaerae bacterium]|jgi:predicted RNase H-like HicB family nuclease